MLIARSWRTIVAKLGLGLSPYQQILLQAEMLPRQTMARRLPCPEPAAPGSRQGPVEPTEEKPTPLGGRF